MVDDPGDGSTDDEVVVLTICASRFEADAMVALLSSYDIRVLLGPAAGGRGASGLDDNCVYVRASDAAEAAEIVNAPVRWPSE